MPGHEPTEKQQAETRQRVIRTVPRERQSCWKLYFQGYGEDGFGIGIEDGQKVSTLEDGEGQRATRRPGVAPGLSTFLSVTHQASDSLILFCCWFLRQGFSAYP